MRKTYNITGMTCDGCRRSVTEALEKHPGVTAVAVNLEKGEALIETNRPLGADELRSALSAKYQLSEKTDKADVSEGRTESKLKQLRPLLLIFAYLFGATVLLNYSQGTVQEAMLDFMGLFFIVFSFFKLLDLKGFPTSFAMYDPLARAVPLYGWIYPFLELMLGLLFLMRLFLLPTLLITILVLGVTTIGVTRTLLNKKAIQCACLGTALKLPMTEATFIENAVMLIMAFFMLFKGGLL